MLDAWRGRRITIIIMIIIFIIRVILLILFRVKLAGKLTPFFFNFSFGWVFDCCRTVDEILREGPRFFLGVSWPCLNMKWVRISSSALAILTFATVLPWVTQKHTKMHLHRFAFQVWIWVLFEFGSIWRIIFTEHGILHSIYTTYYIYQTR